MKREFPTKQLTGDTKMSGGKLHSSLVAKVLAKVKSPFWRKGWNSVIAEILEAVGKLTSFWITYN